jgi:lipoprotein-releasing system permease protein
MSFDWTLALRYLRSKKRAFISVGTVFAILGVALGVAALATVMSVTGGFQKQFRDKVLGVNAHVLITKRSTPDFHEYRQLMERVGKVPGVIAVSPFVINPMLVTAGDRTATGVLMKGIDPEESPKVLDVGKQVVDPESGNFVGEAAGIEALRKLRKPGAKPPERPKGSFGFEDLAPFPPPSGSAAAPGSDPFLDVMGKTVDGLRKQNEELAKDEENEAPAPVASAPAESGGPPPSGAIEPDGGYGSELPPDDVEEQTVDAIAKADAAKIKDEDLPGVAIGRTLAKALGVGIGDRIRITSPAIGWSLTGSARTPVARPFRVIAVFEAGFDQYDSKLVYTDLYEAQAFYDQGDSVTGIEMRVQDIDRARDVKTAIDRDLNKQKAYHVMDWEELNRPLFTALKIQQIMMSAVLALIILVAAFTVVATLIMIVLDKQKEIAVLKAMGASDAVILRAFLWQGLVIGVIGTSIGLLLGFALCRGLLVYGFPLDPKVYFISKLPVEARPQEFLITGAIAIVICLCATIIPALNAASVRPAEGLRAH